MTIQSKENILNDYLCKNINRIKKLPISVLSKHYRYEPELCKCYGFNIEDTTYYDAILINGDDDVKIELKKHINGSYINASKYKGLVQKMNNNTLDDEYDIPFLFIQYNKDVGVHILRIVPTIEILKFVKNHFSPFVNNVKKSLDKNNDRIFDLIKDRFGADAAEEIKKEHSCIDIVDEITDHHTKSAKNNQVPITLSQIKKMATHTILIQESKTKRKSKRIEKKHQGLTFNNNTGIVLNYLKHNTITTTRSLFNSNKEQFSFKRIPALRQLLNKMVEYAIVNRQLSKGQYVYSTNSPGFSFVSLPSVPFPFHDRISRPSSCHSFHTP